MISKKCYHFTKRAFKASKNFDDYTNRILILANVNNLNFLQFAALCLGSWEHFTKQKSSTFQEIKSLSRC